MAKTICYVLASTALVAYSTLALAGGGTARIPEPGTMSLLAGGAIAAAVLHRWRRRK